MLTDVDELKNTNMLSHTSCFKYRNFNRLHTKLIFKGSILRYTTLSNNTKKNHTNWGIVN